ncbi:unnamed protein product (macronuclear) [Paramecium tetraurelia]|uniref:Response regulatory domain-containing protein n=1 Tax=Paramecium tetraurelia TaxID=5888 RepID=A0CB62_PARTE|nr:uncharacterized protein GSPATT00036812001 [Paramecium tetraurelia]CAK68029.1 unnamed protein product [Paramecium tetraurelia]|eukprot:XP_001435426.1 hypothetical protein (macronuclear) [Paramecium tetraurelia strain d4-2]
MQFNWILIKFHSINALNIVLGLILYLQDITQLGSLILLMLNITVMLTGTLILRRKLIDQNQLQQLILAILSVHISYCCFLNRQLNASSYLLLKFQEAYIIKKQSRIRSILYHIVYNSVLFSLLIFHSESIILYILAFYSTLLMIPNNKSNFQLQNQDFELPLHLSKPTTQRNSEVMNIVQDTISNSWMIKLQNIPVGIMIVKKENLQIMFKNQSLLQILEGITDVESYLMNELQFQLQVKRVRKQVRESSIKQSKQLNKIQSNSFPQFQSQKKIPSQQKISNTLKSILAELQNGKLDQIYQKENHLELVGQISKQKQSQLFEDDNIRKIQCKVFCGQNDQEYFIIVDDISLQSYLQKLETREKFQVRIIDSFSHELRTPLNSAKLFLEALLNDPKLQDHYKTNCIEPAANALKLQAYLIRDIIDFTQYHSHLIKYNIQEFNFENIIQEVNDIFKPICLIKNLGLRINVKNSVPPLINSDFDRIMQIIVNIISNSIKYSERGLIILEISCYEKALTFCVKDQGVGIPQNKLQKIQKFLKSYNSSRDVSSQDEWEGFGLLVSQMNLLKLAPQNKSQLRITSRGQAEGCQVTFKIRTTQSTNTQLLRGNTFQRTSLKCAFTVPDLCMGIQGILIINNPKQYNSIIDNSIQQIPIRQQHSVANYFKPQQSTGALNQSVFQETDLIDDQDTDRGNPEEQLLKLNSLSKSSNLIITNSNTKEKQSKKRKQSSFSISDLDASSSNRPNTLISRLIQREEQEIEMEEQFQNLRFACKCSRILSVDDDIFNQKALQVIVSQMGFRLQIAYNGQQAIEVIQKTEKCSEACQLFYFILMDCQMPIMDGWTTTKVLMDMIRQNIIPDIPIIGLTAFNSTEDIERCLDVGMREVFTKPLNINSLKQVLLKLINR